MLLFNDDNAPELTISFTNFSENAAADSTNDGMVVVTASGGTEATINFDWEIVARQTDEGNLDPFAVDESDFSSDGFPSGSVEILAYEGDSASTSIPIYIGSDAAFEGN